MRNATRLSVEHSRRPIPKLAVIQALHHHFKMRNIDIAVLVGCSQGEVTKATVWEGSKVIPWEMRTRQAEAIQAAERLARMQVRDKLEFIALAWAIDPEGKTDAEIVEALQIAMQVERTLSA